jgi:hypothetical protein
MSVILFSLGEPSLLEASKDPSVRSFRLSIFSPVPTRKVAVRLTIAPDGSGRVTSIVAGGKSAEVKRNERSVSAAEVDNFLQLVDRAEFWSMTSSDPYPNTDEKGRPAYVMDPSAWMLEGAQKGSYHNVFRWSPRRDNVYRELARYLAKDLAKLDGFTL